MLSFRAVGSNNYIMNNFLTSLPDMKYCKGILVFSSRVFYKMLTLKQMVLYNNIRTESLQMPNAVIKFSFLQTCFNTII